MEKYSVWRDPSTGVLPFVVPVAANDDAGKLALYALYPFQIIIASIRIVLFVLLVGLYALLETAFDSLSTIPAVVGIFGTYLLRATLFLCFGYYWVNEDIVSSFRRSTTQIATKSPSKPGDIVVANLTSVVDVLYLACRHQPVFALPYASATDRSIRFEAAGLLKMLAYVGQVPALHASPEQLQTLDELVQQANRPVAVFPEGTTSNNRGVLRFIMLPVLAASAKKAQIVTFRHDAPSGLCLSACTPVPSSNLNPLESIFRIAMTPLFPARHLSVRILSPLETPLPSSPDFWSKAASSMCHAGKLKQLNLGWEEKQSFLEVYRKGKKQKRR